MYCRLITKQKYNIWNEIENDHPYNGFLMMTLRDYEVTRHYFHTIFNWYNRWIAVSYTLITILLTAYCLWNCIGLPGAFDSKLNWWIDSSRGPEIQKSSETETTQCNVNGKSEGGPSITSQLSLLRITLENISIQFYDLIHKMI